MLDNGKTDRTFDVAAFKNPFHKPVLAEKFHEGMTIADIVKAADIPPKMYLSMQVRVSLGSRSDVIPMTQWHMVRPRGGCVVEIFPLVHGPAIGAILTAVIGSAAPTLAGLLFPTLGKIGLSIATAAITVVGTLLVRALIPPPDQPAGNDDPTFTLTGASNQPAPYEPYPTVIGRHRMFPNKTATGYTETIGDEVFLRERMTFGYGPIALEDLKIGTTPITEFDDVEVEFLNVDKDLTLANIPGLAAIVKNKTEENKRPRVNLFEFDDQYTFTTEVAAQNVSVVVSALLAGNVDSYTVRLRERVVGAGSWTFVSDTVVSGSDVEIPFPAYAGSDDREFNVRIWQVNTSGGSDTDGAALQVKETRALYKDGLTVSGWRYGTETMMIYPDDVSQDNYSVTIENGSPVVRQTRVNTRAAQVDIAFQGLGAFDNKGRKVTLTVELRFEYRRVGDSTWIQHADRTYRDNTTAFVQFTESFDFGSEGEWEIQVTRLSPVGAEGWRDAANLSAIRSIQSGQLPSHEGISEIALRIKATNELNGQLDNVNGVAQQLGRVWDGSAMSAPQPIRHPAWCYLQALTGPQLRDPVADSRIDLDYLKYWADTFPHWTCDLVSQGETRLLDVLNLICAAGRGAFGLVDLKFSVILDGADGGIVQHFTPRNSWGFVGRRFLDRQIHALRVQVLSEQQEWAQDEIIVYNDGYSAVNATEIETMRLPGVVVTTGEGDQGNAWRLGRYHMAVATLRPEEFTINCELDHLRCQRGSKVRVSHDVPMFGVGFGRVKDVQRNPSVEVTQITLDDVAETSGVENYRLRVRVASGAEIAMPATHAGGGVWNITTPVSANIQPDDLAMVELTAIAPVDMMVKSIRHSGNLDAELTLVPAAPQILGADTGTIPTYDPQITPRPDFGPVEPEILGLRSGFDVAYISRDGKPEPRIGVRIAPYSTIAGADTRYQLRWRSTDSAQFQNGGQFEFRAEIMTEILPEGGEYVVEARTLDRKGNTRGWVSVGTITATAAGSGLPAPENWAGLAGVDTISLFGDRLDLPDVAGYRIYAATAASTTLTLVGTSETNRFFYRPNPADAYTRYRVAGFDNNDDEGGLTAFIEVSPEGIALSDIPAEITTAISDADAKAQLVRDDHDALVAGYTGTLQENLEASQLALQSLGPYEMSLGPSYWQTITASADPGADSPHPFTGSIVTLDGSDNISAKGVIPVSPDKIYRMEIRGQVITDDPGTNNSQMRVGFYSWDEAGTLVNANIQTDMFYSVADGEFIAVKFFSGADFAGQGDRDIAAAARYIRPHLRMNATGNTPGAVAEITSISWQDNTANKRVDQLSVSFNDLDATVTDILAVDINGVSGTAFATMLTELGVNAAGVPATVTAQAVAISDLEGNASASYVFRAEAGGGAADFELVAWGDSTGGGSAIRVSADNILLEGTVGVDKLVSGTGENLIRNSDLSEGLDHLEYEGIGNVGGETTLTARDTSLSYTDGITPTFMLFQTGAETAGSANLRFGEFDLDDNFQPRAVEAGQWYDFSANIALLRAQVRVRIAWYDKDKVFISDSTGPFIDPVAVTDSDPDSWPREAIIAQAPATAKYAVPYLRKFGTTSGVNSYLFAWKPMWSKTHADATVATPYKANGQTIIDGGNIRTTNLTVTGEMIAPNVVSDFDITPEVSGTVLPGGAIVGTSVTVAKPDGYYVRLTINGYVDGNGASTVPDRYIGFVVQVKPPGGSFLNLSDFLAIPNMGGVEVWQTQSYVDIYDPTSNHGDYEFRLQITSNSATESASTKGSLIVEVFKK